MRISDWSSDVCSSDLLRKIADAESRAPVHRHVGDVVAIQGDPAVVGRNEAGDDIEAGGLSRAVGTEQADRLSALQGQSHTAQNRPLLEALAMLSTARPAVSVKIGRASCRARVCQYV